jgi:hypothetical protein
MKRFFLNVNSTVLLLVSAAALVGCAESHHVSTQVALPPAKTTVHIRGGTALERTLMREVVRGMRPRTVRAVRIEKSPPRWWSIRSAVDLHIGHLPDIGRFQVRAGWEDRMIGGAFGRRLIAHGLHGTITLASRYSGDRIQPREFHTPDPQPVSTAQAENVADSFQRAAVRAGARVLEVSAGRPYGPAPSMTLEVRYPARFLKSKLRHLLEIYTGRWRRYEGYYLGIVDDRDRRVLETAGSIRARTGTSWVRRDLVSCSPVGFGPMAPKVKPPPPCPA